MILPLFPFIAGQTEKDSWTNQIVKIDKLSMQMMDQESGTIAEANPFSCFGGVVD